MADKMVWLVGCRGMLGTEVANVLRKKGILFYGTDLEVDITNRAVVADVTTGKNITWIINCAAYTAVDDAEDNRDVAYQINAEGPRNLARAADRLGAVFIHISTDYVFNGNATEPYEADSVPDPRSVYGETKLAGELFARDATRRFIIVRTAWLFGKNGRNFVSTMINLMNSRSKLKAVSDQKGTPTYAVDLAYALAEFVRQKTENYGIYHYTNNGSTNWYEFARAIYAQGKELGIVDNQCSILPISTGEYPTKACRPAFSVLNRSKIESELNITIPEWSDALERFLRNDFLDPKKEMRVGE